jgi:phosphate-selective porin OprO/OprP
VAALRQLIELQNQKIEALSQKVQQLETQEAQRQSSAPEPHLPAIVIDTNGAPIGTLASADTGIPPAKPLPMISAGAGGFSFRSADTNFVLTMHGLVQADARYFYKDNPLSQGNDGFFLRRARPILEGTLFHDCDFLLVPDFGYLSFLLYDASITYHVAPWLDVSAGKFKGPVGLEQLQTDAAAPLSERSLASDLIPLRNVGFQLSGQLAANRAMWTAGVYDTGGDNRLPGNTAISDSVEFGGRVFLQPFINNPASRWQGLGFGVGASYANVSSNSLALPATMSGTQPGYLTTGQQQFFAYNPLLGPVVADGPHLRISPEASYYLGPFGVQGEYILEEQSVLNDLTLASDHLYHDAWQVTGQWVITGEPASFNALVPAHPFNWSAGQWGAWQLVARCSQLDIDPHTFSGGFSDSTTSAQGATAWMVGLNWWLNANVRWLMSFSHTTFSGGGEVSEGIPASLAAPGTVTHQDEDVVFTRIQIAF